jgi:short-subunit dehydrogenase
MAETQGFGTLAVIGSVAGDRGRQSNYAYGAAKGGLAVFLAGLRNRMFPHGVHILTVKPGFVDTPMTAGVPKSALFATPDKVAADILWAVIRGKDEIYTPGFWRFLLAIIRAIPEPAFKRMTL